MISRAPQYQGAAGPLATRGVSSYATRNFQAGFTLLEMCMVLLIIALLVGLTLPSMQSALTEQAVRKDAHQLALMVKTGMIQSAEQHRTYVMDLNDTSIALHPLGEAAAAAPDAANTASFDDTSAAANPGPVDVTVTTDLDSANKLQAPDPLKTNAWVAMPGATQWLFEPGELCKATEVRVARGDAWIQMDFNALTGDVQNESFNLP